MNISYFTVFVYLIKYIYGLYVEPFPKTQGKVFYHAALLTTFNIQTFPFLAACNVNCSVARVTAHKTIGNSHVLPSAGQKTAVRQPSSASAWHRSIENFFGNLVNLN